ncbi:hypothetical protein PSTG_07579 [Puccinia striiformis f. sp. tritici PST-78]|uniref:Uncharacterized protein n=1 Tax=Puccinia striiformis f. sp. tritici PST-78 TaxID=1165861 RepID=A0A0L0VJD4_9BASI|nr:hypothetical protein PSTG_07579 [Puccinia striiformis f. sp. tritici PST-78]
MVQLYLHTCFGGVGKVRTPAASLIFISDALGKYLPQAEQQPVGQPIPNTLGQLATQSPTALVEMFFQTLRTGFDANPEAPSAPSELQDVLETNLSDLQNIEGLFRPSLETSTMGMNKRLPNIEINEFKTCGSKHGVKVFCNHLVKGKSLGYASEDKWDPHLKEHDTFFLEEE